MSLALAPNALELALHAIAQAHAAGRFGQAADSGLVEALTDLVDFGHTPEEVVVQALLAFPALTVGKDATPATADSLLALLTKDRTRAPGWPFLVADVADAEADRFAFSMLMPEGPFLTAWHATGGDLFALADQFEVCRHHVLGNALLAGLVDENHPAVQAKLRRLSTADQAAFLEALVETYAEVPPLLDRHFNGETADGKPFSALFETHTDLTRERLLGVVLSAGRTRGVRLSLNQQNNIVARVFVGPIMKLDNVDQDVKSYGRSLWTMPDNEAKKTRLFGQDLAAAQEWAQTRVTEAPGPVEVALNHYTKLFPADKPEGATPPNLYSGSHLKIVLGWTGTGGETPPANWAGPRHKDWNPLHDTAWLTALPSAWKFSSREVNGVFVTTATRDGFNSQVGRSWHPGVSKAIAFLHTRALDAAFGAV